jgi:glycosyltransferase involved in cell wall biosynthesis
VSAEGAPPRVAILYPIWPHYRSAVGRALDADPAIRYVFHVGDRDDLGIRHGDRGELRESRVAPYLRFGRWFVQPRALALAFSPRYDAVILLGDMHHVTTWLAAPLARATGKRVLFWTHGWRRPDRSRADRLLRLAFNRLASGLLIYSERGARLAIAAGYPADRVRVVYNSLDDDAADRVIRTIEAGSAPRPQELFANPERPLLVCVARLTAACRFDLLIDAAAELASAGRPVNLLLVGDGPEAAALAECAARHGVSLELLGASYDEAVLGPILYFADATVSPGKVGLTALHSLLYGTPVITHGDLDRQMPEVELIDGRTGALFRADDVVDLARAIAEWLAQHPDRAAVREACRAAARRNWTARGQARIIHAAIVDKPGDAVPG